MQALAQETSPGGPFNLFTVRHAMDGCGKVAVCVPRFLATLGPILSFTCREEWIHSFRVQPVTYIPLPFRPPLDDSASLSEVCRLIVFAESGISPRVGPPLSDCYPVALFISNFQPSRYSANLFCLHDLLVLRAK